MNRKISKNSLMRRRTLLKSTALGLCAPAILTHPVFSSAGLDQMIGSMLILGFKGKTDQHSFVKALNQQLTSGLAGGILHLGYNVGTANELKSLNRAFIDNAPGKIFISVDQEGGAVRRLHPSVGVDKLPSAGWLARNLSVHELEARVGRMASQMRGLGFNTNLAPVVDLYREGNPVIAETDRAFGSDVKTVVDYAAAFVRASRHNGVLSVLKHFPGHGSSRTDSHDGFVDISKSWEEIELRPFQKLINADLADMIMGGHLVLRYVTGSSNPVTFSRGALDGLLRAKMRYQGLIITDDLDMSAIHDLVPQREAFIRAVAAGNDLILSTNSRHPDPELAPKAVKWIKGAVSDGRISRDFIEQAANRIAKLKQRLS